MAPHHASTPLMRPRAVVPPSNSANRRMTELAGSTSGRQRHGPLTSPATGSRTRAADDASRFGPGIADRHWGRSHSTRSIRAIEGLYKRTSERGNENRHVGLDSGAPLHRRHDKGPIDGTAVLGAPPFPVPSSPPPPGVQYWAWADLMRRAFDIDVLACPRCGGRLRLIATVEDPDAIRAILVALAESRELTGQAPPFVPASSADHATTIVV